ncbi:MAG: flavin-dependent oxidoreductase, F420-dependent methylene-tetrahydromethanopterin reductase [Actinomycetia bacterium]|nr:flavin-dependent oxidoreductase, F420-dependent methylene-tetrahydromethanopterin reductase [Actinomycetes bacterium]
MPTSARERLGRFGIWRSRFQLEPELAAEIERLGFGGLWVGGSPPADLTQVEELIAATTTLIVATSVMNVWQADPHETAASFARIEGRHPGRFLLGVGVGHPEHTEGYRSPFETLAGFVDVVLADGVPRESLVLAALGPKVLRLSAERAAGANPYLVPAEHSRVAREILGPDALLAPEHKVVIDPDPDRGRALGRALVESPYLGLRNYTSNLIRLGWTEDDIRPPGSDALIDALVAHGTAEEVVPKVTAHLDHGADHVCLQLITEQGVSPVPGYRELAGALSLRR